MKMSYECWAYKNDKPYKMLKVSAESRGEAEIFAWGKFINLGIQPELVKCK